MPQNLHFHCIQGIGGKSLLLCTGLSCHGSTAGCNHTLSLVSPWCILFIRSCYYSRVSLQILVADVISQLLVFFYYEIIKT